MGDGGGERDGDLGETVISGVERGLWGWWRGGDGDLVGGDCDVEGRGEGDLGVGIFAYFAKQGECWERVDGELVLQGNLDIVERGIWGWGSLPISPSKESVGREWRGNWYCRGTQTLWRGGSGGWGSLPISESNNSSGREWRGNWYYRESRML